MPVAIETTSYAMDYQGSSADTKPTLANAGSTFFETDTGKLYRRVMGVWRFWLQLQKVATE
jgi:hypothetical protein